LAGPNLLTGNTDEHWRAVRKGVAPAFSAANMRRAPLPGTSGGADRSRSRCQRDSAAQANIAPMVSRVAGDLLQRCQRPACTQKASLAPLMRACPWQTASHRTYLWASGANRPAELHALVGRARLPCAQRAAGAERRAPGAARRAAFAHVVERAGKLADILADHGAARPVNVDGLLLRESMDIIGAPRFGFAVVC